MGKEQVKLKLKKPQFQGKKGRLLLQLQKSYKGDSRFKLTEKFADDIEVDKLKNSFKQVTDKDILGMQEQPPKMQADEFQQQREKQIELINSFMPQSARPMRKPIQKPKIKRTQELIITRFDPASISGNKMLHQIEKDKRRKEIQRRTVQNNEKKKKFTIQKGVDKGRLKIAQADKLLNSLKNEEVVPDKKSDFFMKWNREKNEEDVFQPRSFTLFM